MSVLIKEKYSGLRLNTEDIFKEIDLNELERRRDAAKYAVKVIKKNVGRKFKLRRSGLSGLTKGFGSH